MLKITPSTVSGTFLAFYLQKFNWTLWMILKVNAGLIGSLARPTIEDALHTSWDTNHMLFMNYQTEHMPTIWSDQNYSVNLKTSPTRTIHTLTRHRLERATFYGITVLIRWKAQTKHISTVLLCLHLKCKISLTRTTRWVYVALFFYPSPDIATSPGLGFCEKMKLLESTPLAQIHPEAAEWPRLGPLQIVLAKVGGIIPWNEEISFPRLPFWGWGCYNLTRWSCWRLMSPK